MTRPRPVQQDPTRCAHCPSVPATHVGCLTGLRICAKHACVECRPIAGAT